MYFKKTKPRDLSTTEADEVAFFAKHYEGQNYNPSGWRLRLRRELNSLRRASGKKQLKRVLSVGCGDGQFELLLSPFAEHITALDISPEAIVIARENAKQAGIVNVDFKCLSISELILDQQFDAVVCLAFLHHVRETDLPFFLRQIFEHIAKDGFFYSQDPNVHGVLRKIGRFLLRSRYDAHHSSDERELDPKELKVLLRSVGFESVKIGYIDLTLIPALYLSAKRPGWPLYFCLGLDWLWCHSVFASLSSGFTSIAFKN
jgi:SAM-dependent methyltransferase